MRRRKGSNSTACKVVKAVILGQDGVGKSALTVRFLTRRYIWEYDRTLEATYRYHTEIENNSIALDLSDTAGENTDEKLHAVATMADLFVLLYSITDRSSFNEAKRIGRYLKDLRNTDSLCLALVGTKSDLEHLRTVNFEEGSHLSGEFKSTFHEISIREEVKEVQDMMYDAIKYYLQTATTAKECLRVPSIGVKRSPSNDRKKLRSCEKTKHFLPVGSHASEISKSKSSVEIRLSPVGSWSSGYNRIKELSSSLMSIGSSSDLRIMDQNHNLKVPSDEEFNRQRTSSFSKAKGPFFIQKAKATSMNKGLKIPTLIEEDVRTVEGCSETKIKKPFTLNRIRKASTDTREWVKDSLIHEKAEKGKSKNFRPSSPSFKKRSASGSENLTTGQTQEKPKGPFSLKSSSRDKLWNSSQEKLRSISSDKARSSSSLTRMKEGITRPFRRRPIYL